jgi:SulP family sulfate permease
MVADGVIGDRHNSNTELIGQGVANILAPFFGGIPATGAIARTMANINNGGRTPVAGIVHTLVLLLVLLFLGSLVKLIPMCCLAGVLVMVSYNMSGWREFVAMRKAPKSDFAVLIITFVLTVCFDLVVAIEVGMIAAAVFFMSRMANTADIRKWTDYEELYDEDKDTESINYIKIPKATSVYEITGPMFFGASDKLMTVVKNNDDCRVMILRMRGVPALEATACATLHDIYNTCKKKGIVLIMSHINEQPLSVLQKDGLYNEIGQRNFTANIHEAVSLAEEIVSESNI